MPPETPTHSNALILDGGSLSVHDVRDVARGGRPVRIGPVARRAIGEARAVVDRRATGADAFYGVNTGFGSLSRHRIAADEIRNLQRNLVRSHAAGVGPPLPTEVVRAMLLILAASLGRGRSGVRPDVVETLLAMLNAGVTPIVPGRGSVGASGDLAPLAHAALVLIGEGEVRVEGRVLDGATALRRAGIEPATLEAKEGLALINGTHLMTAIAALALVDIAHLVSAALCGTAIAIDACRASTTPLDPRLHEARNQGGQIRAAASIARLLAGSQITAAHRDNDPRVQDPYSLRAAPQIIGAAMDAIDQVRRVIDAELGAVTDNPLIFAREGDILSGGNFHGLPLAIALDTLAIALAHVAGVAERRIYWLLKASDGVNPVNSYLSPKPGLHSGLMIVQYTAAACCNELQMLATPASVANIPTAAGIEDYNSMGATSAHQARAAVDLVRQVVAIELLTMAEAMEYQRPLTSGAGVERIYEQVRAVVPRLTEDRPPAPDIAAVARLIEEGAFSAIVE